MTKSIRNKWIVIIVAVIFAVLLFSIALFLYLFFDANVNPKKITLAAPNGKVVVDIDKYGVPHIRASASDNDAFFALGYMHARDRLWQMEFQRRVASGTLSEVFGDATVKQDVYLRTWGFYRAAIEAWDALDPKTKNIIQAYTQGVNVYIAKGQLPLQFSLLHYRPRPWTEVDSVAWQKMMAWNLEHTWQDKINNYLLTKYTNHDAINKFFPAYPTNAPTTLSDTDLTSSNLTHAKPKAQHGTATKLALNTALQETLKLTQEIRNELGLKDGDSKGSNAWVVSGKLTKTGKPILANDVHLALSSPALWYLAELSGPELHVVGATIPGMPLVAIGHNDYIAWGVTHSYVDTQDLYLENKTSLTTRKETINIRNAKPKIIDVQTSKHGPIISHVTSAGKVDNLVAIKWPALQPGDTTVESFTKLNYARNWNDFVEALKYFVTPPQNFIYADVQGNIGYYLPGKIPIRSGWVGTMPVTHQQKYEWTGFIPFAKLPHAHNPPEGFIATANNKIVTDNYLYTLTFRWSVPPFRIIRIMDFIHHHQPITMENTIALQNDTLSTLWLALRVPLLKTKPMDEPSKNVLNLLKEWDGRADVNSRGATVFAYWYQQLLTPSSVSNDQPNEFSPMFVIAQVQKQMCNSSFTSEVNCVAYLSQTLKQAAAKLVSEHGSDANHWTWGDVHHAVFEESGLGKSKTVAWLWNRSASSPGSDFTVNVGAYDPSTMDQVLGPTYRQIIDFSDFNNSLFVIPLGQQDNPFSMHYNDQLPLWLSGKYVPMTFNKAIGAV